MARFDPKRLTAPMVVLVTLTQPGQFQLLYTLKHSLGKGLAATVLHIDAREVRAELHDPDAFCGRGLDIVVET